MDTWKSRKGRARSRGCSYDPPTVIWHSPSATSSVARLKRSTDLTGQLCVWGKNVWASRWRTYLATLLQKQVCTESLPMVSIGGCNTRTHTHTHCWQRSFEDQLLHFLPRTPSEPAQNDTSQDHCKGQRNTLAATAEICQVGHSQSSPAKGRNRTKKQ